MLSMLNGSTIIARFLMGYIKDPNTNVLTTKALIQSDMLATLKLKLWATYETLTVNEKCSVKPINKTIQNNGVKNVFAFGLFEKNKPTTATV